MAIGTNHLKTHKMKKITLAVLLLAGISLSSHAQDMKMTSEKTVEVGGAPMYPSKDIIDNAVNSKDHTTLVAAGKAAGLVETLKGRGPFTVFAPTNDAFKAAGFATEAAIMSANPETLIPILAYHVLAGRVFSSDLVDGATPTMLSGGTTTIDLDGDATLKGKSNTTASRITKTDIVATNGVIHEIDRVLLP